MSNTFFQGGEELSRGGEAPLLPPGYAPTQPPSEQVPFKRT